MNYKIITKNDILSNDKAKYIKSKITLNWEEKNPKYVIAIGGDGTILKAAREYPNAIIFGIHTGHLGFYANYSVEDIDSLIDDVNHAKFNLDQIDTIHCEIIYENKILKDFALNEITILTPPRTLILDVYIDDILFERFRGTGFCISTPFGSTAYNKSLHGSVIDHRIKALQLTEIAGINSNSYNTLSSPIVLASNRRIKLCSITPQSVNITIDNQSYEIKEFKELVICYQENKINLAYNKEQSFIKRVKRSFLK